ncbi:Bug family tripartite tricarboxylate transporter substrate binding protein [Caldovatus aquaticus]|uniref:Tripartite tricarboxylate transporter substrate binding protein n=1 Tax=Caldovatus aquaticus TaxID=2865671 RepID=A0ABS7F1N7_9PROT|nr:tripartite tricarboxylate transporter substrate binding protein [Caldovatus aquaticus]MBW8269474.1 tripartite tricarboxylate transporter substrate binding protein [Caldovatus aquaticus]
MRARSWIAAALVAAGLSGAAPPAALAQTAPGYPNRPIRVVVPFAAGGPTDLVARTIGPKMSATLNNQPVVVENRPGAGGATGVDVVAKAAPDGYTIGFGSAGALAISPGLPGRVMPYDPLRDLAPITLGVLVPEPVVVPAGQPFRTMQEFIAAARAQPGRLNYGHTGPGSMPHLAGELIKLAAGIDLVGVAYRGGAPLTTALLAGEVQAGLADLPVLLPHIRSGALRALAVGTRERLPWLPDVPTMAEVGLPGVDTNNWHGMIAPARVPEPILDAIHHAAATALRDPEVTRSLYDQGAIPGGNSRAEFAAFLRSEIEKWGEVIRRAGLRAE